MCLLFSLSYPSLSLLLFSVRSFLLHSCISLIFLSGNFTIDQEFIASIDWDEELRQASSQRYSMQGVPLSFLATHCSYSLQIMTLNDAKSFILPQHSPGDSLQPQQTFHLRSGSLSLSFSSSSSSSSSPLSLSHGEVWQDSVIDRLFSHTLRSPTFLVEIA